MALTLPLVYSMEPLPALIVLAGITFGANFGNSTSAILLNVPGDPGALATAIDGHKLALAGRAGPALAVAAISSFVAAVVGTLGIALLSPLLLPIALGFGPAELCLLLLLALTLVSALSSGSMGKAVLMALFGMALTFPGFDPLTGEERFTFGSSLLADGFGLVPVAMGLFAFGEMFYLLRQRRTGALVPHITQLMPTKRQLREIAGPTGRGSVLGFLVGVLPGAGSTPAAFAAYGVEKKIRPRAGLGTGSLSGVAAPESANNAAAAGAFVPLMTLGIPGSAPLALILGTLTVLGARPGPLFISEQPDLFWGMVAGLLIASALLLVLNLPLAGLWARVLSIPFPLLVTIVLTLTIAGVFTVRGALIDVWVALALGIVGMALRHANYPLAPVLLGFVLGSELERSLRTAVSLSNGDWTTFVNTPLRAIMLAGAILALLAPTLRRIRRKHASASDHADQHSLKPSQDTTDHDRAGRARKF